jgi:hypothetical protein
MCDSRTAWDPKVIKESLFDKPIIGWYNKIWVKF